MQKICTDSAFDKYGSRHHKTREARPLGKLICVQASDFLLNHQGTLSPTAARRGCRHSPER